MLGAQTALVTDFHWCVRRRASSAEKLFQHPIMHDSLLLSKALYGLK